MAGENKKSAVIVAGGALDDAFARLFLERERPEITIAADAGMGFFYRSGIMPDAIIGDFDSAGEEALSYFRGAGSSIRELSPIKDDTDTEAAVRLAISLGAGEIAILGGTGSRLDHVLANIELLGIGLSSGIPMALIDPCNRVRMIGGGLSIKREGQFGRYVSLIPFTPEVERLTLTGFRYPLRDATLRSFCSLGVSNEIVAEEATISFDGGILLVIESKDGIVP